MDRPAVLSHARNTQQTIDSHAGGVVDPLGLGGGGLQRF